MDSTSNLAQKFQHLFRSNESAVTFGFPTNKRKSNGKLEWKYSTYRRAFNERDVIAHLRGERSIVAIPIRQDSTCSWGAIDIDEYGSDLRPLAKQALTFDGGQVTFECFPSKSGGAHLFIFFAEPQPAHRVRQLLKWSAARFGFPNAEVFPKQDKLDDATQCGNGINLPFFNAAAAFANFNPQRFSVSLAEWPQSSEEIAPRSAANKEDGDGEPGYWEQAALLALLQAFQKSIPEFHFRPCRHGYSVPCPGNLADGWPDGARHSTEDRLLTHETLVWLRNGWPVFRCVHAHCDGGAGEPKKTWKDFIEYYDPLRLIFDFDEWQEQALNLAADQCWSGSTTSTGSLSRPESALSGDDCPRGAQ